VLSPAFSVSLSAADHNQNLSIIDRAAAVEKQKFVYIMNRDANNKLTISSPLEAHKAETIIFSVVGVDVGFDNPIFALIELEYKEADQDPTGKSTCCCRSLLRAMGTEVVTAELILITRTLDIRFVPSLYLFVRVVVCR
jgi:hypothetical protein